MLGDAHHTAVNWVQRFQGQPDWLAWPKVNRTGRPQSA